MTSATQTDEDRELSRREDRVMLEAVLAGDGTAYRGLVEKYQNRVYGTVYGVLRNREDARDVTQEAFVKAYRKLDTFRLEASFSTWLFRIAMNLAIDVTRRRKRQEVTGYDESIATRDADGGISDDHHGGGPGRMLERKQLFAQIMDAMEQLTEDQRQVILLREMEGLSYKEISEIMDIPSGTVMSRLFYARKKLQKLLSDDLPSTSSE